MTQPRTDKEIRGWVSIHYEHRSKAEQRKARDYLKYVRDFYESYDAAAARLRATGMSEREIINKLNDMLD